MRNAILFSMLVTAVVLSFPANGAILNRDAGPGAKWVEVRGESVLEGKEDDYKKEALKRAERAALEEAGKTFIESQTKVENFETIADEIYSYTEGLVTDVAIMQQGRKGDRYFMVIQCKVHTAGIAEKWQILRALVEKRGKPRIMVMISETVDRRYSPSGTAQTLIQDELLKRRMPLVDSTQMAEIAEAELREAQLEVNLPKAVALAKRFNAEIIIVGTSEAAYEGVNDTFGVPLHRSNAEVQVRAVKTATGEVMVSKRASVNSSAPERQKAEKDALAKAGSKVAEDTVRDLVRMWFFEEDRGQNITLNITGISFRELREVEDFLKKQKGVANVNRRSYARQIAQVEVQGKMTVDDLAELLLDAKLAEFEVLATNPGSIDLSVKGAKQE